MMSEFTDYSREKFPNVDGVVAIPHNKGCGCPDGSNVDVLLRVLSNYADHPNVGGVVLIELGCEKTNLSVVENYLGQSERALSKPLVRIGVQDVGGTQAAIERGLAAVTEMLPQVNAAQREKVSLRRTGARRKVRRFRCVFRNLGESQSWARGGYARTFKGNGIDHRGPGVLRRRTCSGKSGEGCRDGAQGLSDGGLVSRVRDRSSAPRWGRIPARVTLQAGC